MREHVHAVTMNILFFFFEVDIESGRICSNFSELSYFNLVLLFHCMVLIVLLTPFTLINPSPMFRLTLDLAIDLLEPLSTLQ